ncbi:MAG: hypothetical protein FJ241_13470 [Nitrospira sp.]|nr:hypothetical protein [Nitrospira sp.]
MKKRRIRVFFTSLGVLYLLGVLPYEIFGTTAVVNEQFESVHGLMKQLRFSDAHDKLLEYLVKINNEAHFELAQMLLAELKWTRRIITKNSTLTPADKAALEKEKTYRGLIRLDTYQYKTLIPYSRQINSGLTMQITAAWMQFDYLRLIILELNDYLQSAKSNSANALIAKKWLNVLRPIAGKISYHPMEGFDSVATLGTRLKELASVAEALDSGKISVKEPTGDKSKE